MAETCSHHDVSRKGVGVTAHFVAALRSIENDKDVAVRLFRDPYAGVLAGELGARSASKMFNSAVTSDKPENSEVKVVPLGLIEGVAIRTRKIDDETIKYLIQEPLLQICVLGAGLDTRPWRIDLSETDHSTVDISRFNYFEVDFPEMFDYKLPLLQTANAVSKFNYVSVVADLSVSGWTEKLISAGLIPQYPHSG